MVVSKPTNFMITSCCIEYTPPYMYNVVITTKLCCPQAVYFSILHTFSERDITVINNSIVNIELGKNKLDINDISVKTEFCS